MKEGDNMKEMWEYFILRCIDLLGGGAYLKQIYKKIPEVIDLTEDHLKEQYGRPAYQNQIRSHIANLCQSGNLDKISRGEYSLTEKGRKKLLREKSLENPIEI